MPESTSAAVQQLTVHEVHKKKSDAIESAAALHHFDVRRVDELQADGFIASSVHIPLADLAPHHLPDEKDQPLIFSCAAGGRSMTAAQRAIEWGYTNVSSMDGGFRGWKAAGLPVVTGFSGQPLVKCIYDQPTGTCQYIVYDSSTKKSAIIDPVLDFDVVPSKLSYQNAEKILSFIKQHGLDVEWILETHAHADHLSSSQYLKTQLGGKPKIAIGVGITSVQKTFGTLFNSTDLSYDGRDFDHLFNDGECFKLGQLDCKVLHVPGHTPDHLCYVIGESVFVGDSIFMPDSGSARCDFPGGSAIQLFHSIRKVLFSLPDHTRVFVGHDYTPNGRSLVYQTTIASEKLYNPHVKLDITEDQFVKTREDRDKTLGNPRLLFQSLQVNIRAGKLPTTKSNLFPDRVLFTIPVQVPSAP